MSLVLEGKPVVSIEDGTHKGIITKVAERLEPYHYVDVFIEVKVGDNKVELKYGAPANINANTKLGKLVETFTGKPIEIGKQYNLEEVFVGRKVTFMSLTETSTKAGETRKFVRVVEGSLKPDGDSPSASSVSSKPKISEETTSNIEKSFKKASEISKEDRIKEDVRAFMSHKPDKIELEVALNQIKKEINDFDEQTLFNKLNNVVGAETESKKRKILTKLQEMGMLLETSSGVFRWI